MLQAEHLSKSFGGSAGKQVLDRLDLRIEPQECVAVIAPRGTGKSTLLNVLGGLLRADSGHLWIEGVEIEALNDAELANLRRRRIGFIFQAFHLLPHLSAGLNIALPLQLDGMSRAEALKRAAELMQDIDLIDCMDALPGELAHHEAHKVSVARALAHRPAVVLADELATGMDPQEGVQLIHVLKHEFKRSGACGLVMTDNLEIARAADRILRLEAGRLFPIALETERMDIPSLV